MAVVAMVVLICGVFLLGVIRRSEFGVSTLLLLAAGTFLNDAGAQAIGKLCAGRLRAYGRNALARRLAGQPFKHVSPGKTWVGLVGGLAVGWLAGAGVLWWLNAAWDYPLAYGIALAVITPPLAVCGDAIESAAKRSLGIKDMSSVLGAHGGLADRLDAIAATAIGAAVLQLLLF